MWLVSVTWSHDVFRFFFMWLPHVTWCSFAAAPYVICTAWGKLHSLFYYCTVNSFPIVNSLPTMSSMIHILQLCPVWCTHCVWWALLALFLLSSELFSNHELFIDHALHEWFMNSRSWPPHKTFSHDSGLVWYTHGRFMWPGHVERSRAYLPVFVYLRNMHPGWVITFTSGADHLKKFEKYLPKFRANNPRLNEKFEKYLQKVRAFFKCHIYIWGLFILV